MPQWPARVNLVYDGDWALSKKGWGDCPGSVVRIPDLLRRDAEGNAFRRCGDYRWKIVEESEPERTSDGNTCIAVRLRNDHHPQRHLRAGAPMMIEDCGMGRTVTDHHRWLLEYPAERGGAGRRCSSFHIRSRINGLYLSVEAGHLQLSRKRPPVAQWRAFSAARKWQSVQGDWQTISDAFGLKQAAHFRARSQSAFFLSEARMFVDNEPAYQPLEDLEIWLKRSRSKGKATSFPASDTGKTDSFSSDQVATPRAAAPVSSAAVVTLEAFQGDVAEVFEAVPNGKMPDRSHFTAIAELLSHAEEGKGSASSWFGDLLDLEAAPEVFDTHRSGLRVEELFPMLCGASENVPNVLQAFHERRGDWDVSTTLTLPGTNALETSGVTYAAAFESECKVPVPILKCAHYAEVCRLALCCRRPANCLPEKTLIFHVVGHVDIGKLYGKIRTESVYFFSQREAEDGSLQRIRLRALFPIPKGRFTGQAISGQRKAFADFELTLKELLPQCRAVATSHASSSPSLALPQVGEPQSQASTLQGFSEIVTGPQAQPEASSLGLRDGVLEQQTQCWAAGGDLLQGLLAVPLQWFRHGIRYCPRRLGMRQQPPNKSD
eukprot:TRINITY_DN21161_c0_g1_i1.p1 TRINITY_DN21161_c0_g1~~TRINITY_DN21161_c0_g1_i1.p1  ORF type:complete len:605 (-),score=59.21 TRINITY_DN21161_c0_g1_i1:219-2033(-)